ncbi:MAG: hypothetical protein K6F69_06310 [Treponema sp.]|nr:hypothetical protein [Treponema sp.]
MNKKYVVLVVALIFLFPVFVFGNGKSYWAESIEVQGMLFDYHFYKTQEQFDKDFFNFVLSNTPYTKDALLEDYKYYGKSFIKNDLLNYKVRDIMIKNGYMYSVTTYMVGGVAFCVINKRIGETFYNASFYRQF